MTFWWLIIKRWRRPKDETPPPVREPASTLDQILHDFDWYKPKDLRKERKDERNKGE